MKTLTAEDFDPGDIVRLRSGGPHMHVVRVVDGRVECWWTKKNEETDSAFFVPATLVKQRG